MRETDGVCAIVPRSQTGFRPHVFGMGLLVANREVVTCAHVIDFALGGQLPESSGEAVVRICFPFADGVCVDGVVDRERWFPADRSSSSGVTDIAVVRLKEDAPAAARQVALGRMIPGAEVRSYGFRSHDVRGGWFSHPDGEWVRGHVVGPQPGGRAQFDGLSLTGQRVQRGFSGAAVYDSSRRVVIGMIVEADRDATTRVAQLIDSAAIEAAIKSPGTGAIDKQPAGEVTPAGSWVTDVPVDESRLGDGAIFVGRRRLERLFMSQLAGKATWPPVHIVGHGGIGKSALLHRLSALARRRGVEGVCVDLAFVRSPLDLLRKLNVAMQARGVIDFPAYRERCERYAAIEGRLLNNPDLDKRIIRYASRLPEMWHKAASANLLPSQETVTHPSQAADVLTLTEMLDPDDREFFLNPLPAMTQAFAGDLHAYGQKVVIQLDRTERAALGIGQWLWRDCLPTLKNVMLMTAGRDDITQSWKLPPGRVRVHELEPLTPADGKLLLHRLGVTDAGLQERIARSSEGVPLALELAVEVAGSFDFSRDGDRSVDAFVVDRMIRVFLEEIPEQRHKVLQQLSIFRQFNRETLAELGLGGDVVEDLLAIRFMKHIQHGYAVHDRIRDFVLRDLRRQEPSAYRSSHARAAEFYKSKIGTHLDGDVYLLEWLYHTLCANPESGFVELRAYFTTAALAIKPDFCEAIIRVAQESDVDGSLPHLWLRFFEGSIARQRFEFDRAAEVYQAMLAAPDIDEDQELKSELLYQRSVALWYLCRFAESEDVARESVRLNRKLGKTHFRNRSQGVVALALDRMGQFQAAVRAARRMARDAADGDPVSVGYALNSIGYFSYHAGRWRASEQALTKCREQWIRLRNPVGQCYPIGHLGLLYSAVGQYELGLDLLNRGRHLCELSGNLEMLSKIMQNLSFYHLRVGHLDEARRTAEEAMSISERLKHPYYQADSARLLAQAHVALGDRETATHAVESGLQQLAGTGAVYLLSRLEVLKATIDVDHAVTVGHVDCGGLQERLSILGAESTLRGFDNIAANAELASYRLLVHLGAGDPAASLVYGAERAFAYNWYTGMDFLEAAREIATGSGLPTAVRAVFASFSSRRLCELYSAAESHRIPTFKMTDLARASAFTPPC